MYRPLSNGESCRGTLRLLTFSGKMVLQVKAPRAKIPSMCCHALCYHLQLRDTPHDPADPSQRLERDLPHRLLLEHFHRSSGQLDEFQHPNVQVGALELHGPLVLIPNVVELRV